MNLYLKTILLFIYMSMNVFAQYSEAEWIRTYSNPDSSAMSISTVVDSFGNIYQTGYISDNLTFHNVVTIKYNSDGEQQWIREYNGSENADEQPTSIAIDNNGNIIVAGFEYVLIARASIILF